MLLKQDGDTFGDLSAPFERVLQAMQPLLEIAIHQLVIQSTLSKTDTIGTGLSCPS